MDRDATRVEAAIVWPRKPGECLFMGGHSMLPQGRKRPKYCVWCGHGYDPEHHAHLREQNGSDPT